MWRVARRALLTALVLAGSLLTGLRLIPAAQLLPGAPYVASFTAAGALVWALVAVLAATSRRRPAVIGAVLAVLLAGLHASWLLPYYRPDAIPATGSEITIASVNVLGGGADPDRLTAAVEGADVVVLLEYSPSVDAALVARNWNERYPHHVGGPAPWAAGTKVFSRLPVQRLATLQSLFNSYLAELTLPDGRPLGLVAAHPANPLFGVAAWRDEAAELGRGAQAYDGERLVVIGDLNSTPDHVTLQRLRSDAGLRDAADEAGAGWLRTWPADRGIIPPLFGLDQALLRGPVYAVSVRSFPVPGTDHLGVRVTLRIPDDKRIPDGKG